MGRPGVPFGAEVFDVGESVTVEDLSCGVDVAEDFLWGFAVGMPVIEVKWGIVLAAVIEEEGVFFASGCTCDGAADLEFGEFGLDGACGDFVEFAVLLEGSAFPLAVAAIGFAPDLPVFDSEVFSVVPSFIVVSNDVETDLSPLMEILRRFGKDPVACIFDGGSEAEDGGCAGGGDVFKVVVGRSEDV